MQRVGSFRVPADHPCLAGHFPGHPLVPGVLMLDHASRSIAASLPGAVVAGFRVVKCTGAIGAGEEVEIRRAAPAHGQVAFECRCAGRLAARGTALLGAPG